jgi:hypothetical protein
MGQLWNGTEQHCLYLLDFIIQYIAILPMFKVTASVQNIDNSPT